MPPYVCYAERTDGRKPIGPPPGTENGYVCRVHANTSRVMPAAVAIRTLFGAQLKYIHHTCTLPLISQSNGCALWRQQRRERITGLDLVEHSAFNSGRAGSVYPSMPHACVQLCWRLVFRQGRRAAGPTGPQAVLRARAVANHGIPCHSFMPQDCRLDRGYCIQYTGIGIGEGDEAVDGAGEESPGRDTHPPTHTSTSREQENSLTDILHKSVSPGRWPPVRN